MLGFALSRDEGLGAVVRRNMQSDPLCRRCLSCSITAVLVWFNWFPDPTKLPEPRLLFLNGKSFLTPMRLIQFLALAAVFSAAYPAISRLGALAHGVAVDPGAQLAQRVLRGVAAKLERANRSFPLHGLLAR